MIYCNVDESSLFLMFFVNLDTLDNKQIEMILDGEEVSSFVGRFCDAEARSPAHYFQYQNKDRAGGGDSDA
jgi:hypothetical protein